ncbi:peptidoglycan D,D-transpeptidase FtsI family protein [Vallitalea longa]|uniref:peptidoglycan D,D-transpeptidase FtsI family protein n=1 Tax=Vallitalea longa TaxID=2936439 RepID=UPI0024909CEA|nr:penicillin-binding transpeptidase domain-containing protein [Vallitalea longa]
MNSISKHTYKAKRNLFLLFFIFIICIALLIVKICSIVNADSVNYKKNVLSQQVNNSIRYNNLLEPKRGTIYDRNGRIFAESKKVYDLIFDPGVLSKCKEKDIDKTVDFLVNTYEFEESTLRDLLKNRNFSNYEVLATKLNYNDIEKDFQDISNRKYKGLNLVESYKRIYPNNNMLSDVLGFVNNNKQGCWGVEESFEGYLRGEEGREFGVINDGKYIQNMYIEPKNGNDIILTIDQTIQYYLEEAIKANLEVCKPKNIYAIATNPQNGEVLAMASYPDYNLNDPYDLTAYFTEEEIKNMPLEKKSNFLNGLWRNFNISDTYEPGSTFKPFVAAAAIEEKKVGLSETFHCSGSKTLYNRHIACWKGGGHGDLTIVGALENSCNVAFMDIGAKIGKEIFCDYQKLFGFDSKTNIDLIGEGNSTLHKQEEIGPVELATSSFGQTFNITPIQLISAFGSLINGGYLYEPHVMKKIVNEDGNIVEVNKNKEVRQVISAKTAQYIKEALHSVVVNGTAKPVSIEGYDIGGKTGTAEKFPRSENKKMVSFMGFAPVDDPKLLLLVIIDEPDVPKPSSSYAQNIFKSVMEKALPYMNIYPRIGTEQKDNTNSSPNETEVNNNQDVE